MMNGFGYGICRGIGGAGGGMGMIAGLIGLLMLVGLIASVAFFFVWLLRHLSSDRGHVRAPHTGLVSPRDLAAQRYARGEITREQYLQILSDLSGGSSPGGQ